MPGLTREDRVSSRTGTARTLGILGPPLAVCALRSLRLADSPVQTAGAFSTFLSLYLFNYVPNHDAPT